MKFLKKKIIVLVLIAFVFVCSFALVSAETCDPSSGKVCNPIKVDTVNGLIKIILEGVLTVIIPVIALAIIYSGFLFVSARGNTEKLGKAKDALLYSAIGAAIILGSWAIAQMISETVLQIK